MIDWLLCQLFWLSWPVVKRHLRRSTVTSCWMEAQLKLMYDAKGIGESQRSAAMQFAKAMTKESE